MAIGKTAGCLILAAGMWASAEQFSVRHDHLHGSCNGILTVDDEGVRYSGEKGHSWKWAYADIEQFKLGAGGIDLVTYRDNLWRLGADQEYHFDGKIPASELYTLLESRLDQRFIAEMAVGAGEPIYTVRVKHLRRIRGSEGTLTFGSIAVVYSTDAKGESRTWRYSDIENISNSGPFELTLNTFERGRQDFQFQLKQAIPEARYNELWLHIERKNGKLQ